MDWRRLMSNKRTIATGLLAIVALLALILAASAPALAGLRLAGAIIQDTLAPGETASYVINVGNTAEGPMDIAIDIRGLGNYLSGGPNTLQPSEDQSPYTARGYVSASPSSFHLEPGQSQDVTVNAALPADAGDGGRYATVYIYTIPSGSGMLTSAAVVSQLYITIENSNLIRSGDLTSLELAPPQSQQAFSVSATVLNTGNYHYKLSFNGTVTNSQGQTVGETLQTNSIYTLIPTFFQQVDQIPFNIYSDLPAGVYTVEVEARTQEGVFLDSGTVQFVLSDTYKPVPVRTLTTQLWGTSASWAMSEDGMLLEDVVSSSADSTINIFIENGTTVLGPDGQPLVAMNISRMDPPPSAPTGYEMISAFRFEPDGATFDPEARFTVKYSQSDIPKGVKENRLEIAVLNPSSLQWQILNSDVNAGANTITFSTGHLSVYALISPPASASAGIWLWIVIGLAVVAVLGLIIFIYKRRQGKKAAKKKTKSRGAPKAGTRQEADDW